MNFEKSCQVRLSSTENVWVVDLQWNPGIANMIGAVTSDGAAIVCELTQNGPVINSIPPNSQSLCLCWSPKGKRVVIGSKGGSIMQYMPELKVVKAIPTPSFPQKNMNIISIRWLSNTQFIAVYKDSQDQSGSSAVIVINAPQNKEPQFINYDDMFCGGLTERSEHYFIHIPQWNMIILGNGNALESAVLCQENDLWVQWSIDDGFRAELPLSDNHADVYNVGMAVDFSPQYQVLMDENMTLGPRPLLLMYSHIGVLCLFHSLNFVPGAPELCIQPQNLPRNLFTEKQQEAAQVTAPPVAPPQAPVSTQSSFQFSMPNFGPTTVGQSMGLTMQGQTAFSSGQTPFNFSNASQLSQFASPPKTVPPPSSSFQQVQPQPKIELSKTVEPPKTTPATQPSAIDLSSLLGQSKASDFGIQQSFGLPQTQITGTPQKPLLNKPEAPVSVSSQPPPVKETPKEGEKPSAEALEKARKEKEKALIDAMVKEFKVVDLEFKDYKKKISNFNLTIGDDSFLSTIPSKVADFEMFEKDLSETTGTQSAEVNILRCNLVELYGYVENIKARDRHIKSQRYLECLESQSLDPVTKKHIKNIEQQMHFVDSQIKQATAYLDAIWTSHKNSKAKDTLDIPNMESIYQAMVSQSHILSVQKNIVNDQYNKLRQHLKRVKKIPQVIEYSSPSYNAKTGESNLDILADKLLHTTLDSKSPSKSFKETSCRYIVLANAKKNLCPSKEKSLGMWHKSHKVITTKPVKPFGNEDDDFLQTPSPASVIEKTPEPSKPQKTDYQKSFSTTPQSSVLVKEINKTVAPEKGTKSAVKVDKTIPTYGAQCSSTPVKPTHSISTTPLSTPFSGNSFSSWSSPPLSAKPFAQLSLPNEVAVTKTSKPETTTSIFSGSSVPPFTFTTTTTAKTAVTTSLSPTLIQKDITPKSAELKLSESKEAKSALPLKTTTPSKATISTPLFGSNSFTLSPATSLKNVSSESATSIFGGSTASTTPLFSGVNSLSFSSLAVSTPSATTVSSTSTPSKITTVTTSVTATTPSVFNLSALNTGQASLFGGTQTTSAPSGSLFGGLPSATTVFAVTTSSNAFGSSPSLFGAATTVFSTASDTVSTTIFGGTGTALNAYNGTPTTAALPATTSMFGASTNTATTIPSLTTTTSLFGGTITSTNTSLFGNTPATTTSLFGATTASATSVFGGTPTTATPTTSIFAGTTTTPSTTSMFAGTTTTTPPTTSMFAGTTTTPSTTSLFAGTTTTPSTTSLFAGTTTTTPSLFAGTTTTPSTTSMFAGTTTTPTTSSFSAPLFGTTPTTNVFGTATTASMFGGTASFGNTTATTTSSVFGSPTTSSSVFGTSFGSTVTTSSVFGGTATTSSVFGGTATTSVFGSPATTSSSVFGAAHALSSTSFFGTPTTSSFQTPAFGQSPQQFSSSPFFQTTTPTTAQQNVFASTSFTQATTASSLFGGSPTFSQSTGNIFGNAATPNKFNTSSGSLFGGSFTSPTQPQGFSSGQTGGLFGSNSSFQSSPQPQAGFGSPPAFGSGGSSIFGGSQTSFGAAPTFGGSATFGSPKKVFGETAAAPSFGTPTQQSPTFENLAGQNTLSFGNLAQNQSSFGTSFGTPPQNQQPAFPTSTFGGSSFSSWR